MTDLEARLAAAVAGRYRVERELGAGGMATVFLAEDLRHRRQIALKVLRNDFSEQIGADRFLNEIEIAAALMHPHILPLHDSGEADGLLYYVMPFVEGPSLRDILDRDTRLPVDESIKFGREVIGALDYAHRRGVVHRDIKPENVMVYEDAALVTDFGIALAVRSGHGVRMSEAGVVIGTPPYMSPEQSLGDPVDARSDLYSVACVIYEMLGGTPPFVGDTPMAITAQKLVDPVPPLRALREEVPEEVDAVLARALAAQADERYATAAEFGAALEAAFGGEGARATPRHGTTAARGAPSIAVLPFVNAGGDPDSEVLSDGIAEELTNALSRLDGLRVVARGSAFAFKGKQEDVRGIGERLGVGTVLEGSVRRAGSRVRVSAELVNVADGCALWSEHYDRQVDDVFAIQDEIASAIADVLEAKLLRSPKAYTQEVPRTGDPKAYEQYLKGRHLWNQRSAGALHAAVEAYEAALAIDPEHAPSHAGIADAYVILGVYSHRPPDEVMPKAKAAAERALAIDGSLVGAHTALACVRALYEWDWSGADAAFRRAIAHNPQYATAHQWYATNCLIPQRRFDAAKGELDRALELDPLSLAVSMSIGLLHFYRRDLDAAARALRGTLEMNRDFGTAHYFLGHVHLAAGRYDEAVEALERATTLQGGSAEVTAGLACAMALAYRHSEAEALLATLERRAGEAYVSPALIAQVRLTLNDVSTALGLLERAAEIRAADLAWLKIHPIYDRIRGHPRFRALLERIGLA